MKERINVSLDNEIAERLRQLARDSKRTVSQWITDSVIQADNKQNIDAHQRINEQGSSK